MTSDVDKFNSLSEEFQSTSPELIKQEAEIFGYNSIDVTMNTLRAWHIPDTISNAIVAHLLNTIEGYFDPTELLETTTALDASDTDSSTLEEILSIADKLSCIIQQNPDIEELEENEVEVLIRNTVTDMDSNTLFLPPAALAKFLPTVAGDAKELAASLGVG